MAIRCGNGEYMATYEGKLGKYNMKYKVTVLVDEYEGDWLSVTSIDNRGGVRLVATDMPVLFDTYEEAQHVAKSFNNVRIEEVNPSV